MTNTPIKLVHLDRQKILHNITLIRRADIPSFYRCVAYSDQSGSRDVVLDFSQIKELMPDGKTLRHLAQEELDAILGS